MFCFFFLLFFFFDDTATTVIYTLSLHDALPIYCCAGAGRSWISVSVVPAGEFMLPARSSHTHARAQRRSEEHTSELQSQSNLVCRLLLEKKKKKQKHQTDRTHTVRRDVEHTTRD